MTLPANAKRAVNTEPGPMAAKNREGNPSLSSKSGVLRRLGETGRIVLVVAVLFHVGLAAGLYSSWTRHAPTPEAHNSAESPTETPPTSAPPEAESRYGSSATRPVADHARADELLKRGWYEQALALYEASNGDGSSDVLPSALQFKIALCHDGLGNWDRAIATFGDVIARSTNEQLTYAARLARARLWFRMRNIEESKLALCDLLQRAVPESPGGSADAESCSLFGLMLAMEALGTEPPDPKHESSLVFAALDWRPESQLIWTEPLANSPSREPEHESSARASVDVWPTGPAIYDCDVTLTAQHGTAMEIIRQVADSANITCVWTDPAREIASRKRMEITTRRLSWPTLIASLTEPLRITWELRDGKLHLCSDDEIGEDERSGRRANIAQMILLAAARESHRSPEAGIAYLGLGNLAFADGHLAMAASWFERFTNEYPRSPQTVQAYFNLGVVLRSTGETAAARVAFLHAIDTTASHPLVPLAHLFVGRIFLDDCDPEGAIAPLRRAVTTAIGSDTRPAAVIDLAAALMLAGNWRTACTLLVEHHTVLDQPAYRQVVAFLGTYARYRTLTDRKQVQREGQALISSLMALPAETSLPACGVLLVGRAYAELGLDEQMAETYTAAIRRGVPKPIAHEIYYELAEFEHLAGKDAEATKHFTIVLRRGTPTKSRRAGMRVAEIALADNRTDDCLKTCRELLATTDKSDLPAILRLMGNAFEKAGDHKQAARCYAGQPPAP